MSAPLAVGEERHCVGKIAHATAAGAYVALRRQARRARFAPSKDGRLGVYRCPHCTLWHIGNSVNVEHRG